jgi:ParB-like chromosome segregation protein Spo0J
MFSTRPEPAVPLRHWPADQVERWSIERLKTHASNPRLHSEADLGKIAASILKWGWTMPVLVDENGMLISGEARIAAALKLKLKTIPVIVARGWNEAEKCGYRLTDNQLAARASWDFERLGSELGDLKFSGFDLNLIGFEPEQLEAILASSRPSGLTDPDSVPEALDQPVSRLGDVWLLGDHRIGCGDSTSATDVAPVLGESQPHVMVTDR